MYCYYHYFNFTNGELRLTEVNSPKATQLVNDNDRIQIQLYLTVKLPVLFTTPLLPPVINNCIVIACD